MFLGKGDTSKLEDDEQRTLAHIRRMVETGHLVSLNAEQTEVALRAIDWYGQWESVFRLGKSLRNTLLLIGFFLGLWWATNEKIAAWIASAAGGN